MTERERTGVKRKKEGCVYGGPSAGTMIAGETTMFGDDGVAWVCDWLSQDMHG